VRRPTEHEDPRPLQLPGPVQVSVTPVIEEAEVDSVDGVPPPVVNCVEVIVRFQPEPLPVESVTVAGTV